MSSTGLLTPSPIGRGQYLLPIKDTESPFALDPVFTAPASSASLPAPTNVTIPVSVPTVIPPSSAPIPDPIQVTPPTAANSVLQYPLSTKGNQIVDAKGQPVQLAGVNWYGMNTSDFVPQGLWARDYKSMISQIKSVGFNLIRVPFSYDSVYAGVDKLNDGINYWLGSNSELRDKRPIEILDLIIQEAGRQGLMILLENHNFQPDTLPPLWYQDGYTESMWIDMWKTLAQRYANQPNVIGADLKNEPHVLATWGNGDRSTDWRLAAERAGNEVLAVNPKWLIVVEGIGDDPSDPVSNGKRYWWGQNLERAGQFPVRLNVPNRLVYSPHDYGPGNARTLKVEQFIPYLTDPSFPNNLEPRWDTAFGYLHDQNVAPVFMGEFGGPGAAYYDRDKLWQDKLIPYLDRKDMSWAYWAWNPQSYESGGGILGYDWNTINSDRFEMLKPLLEEATPVPKLP